MASGCWMRSKPFNILHNTHCKLVTIPWFLLIKWCPTLTCFVEARMQPKVVWPAWVLKLLMLCGIGICRYFLIVFSSCKLLKGRPVSPLQALVLTTLQAAWWLHTAKLYHLWLCFLARVHDCNLLCFNLWLLSSIPNPASLKNLSILCWNLSLCCFPIPPCKLSTVISERAGIEWVGKTDPPVWQKGRCKGSCYKKHSLLCK